MILCCAAHREEALLTQRRFQVRILAVHTLSMGEVLQGRQNDANGAGEEVAHGVTFLASLKSQKFVMLTPLVWWGIIGEL